MLTLAVFVSDATQQVCGGICCCNKGEEIHEDDIFWKCEGDSVCEVLADAMLYISENMIVREEVQIKFVCCALIAGVFVLGPRCEETLRVVLDSDLADMLKYRHNKSKINLN